mgnify:CR=1 FL=1
MICMVHWTKKRKNVRKPGQNRVKNHPLETGLAGKVPKVLKKGG